MSEGAPVASKKSDPGELQPQEFFWRDHQPWLESKGYMLRPRYRPDWVPSWQGTKYFSWNREDGILQPRINLLDATRISDGKIVMLKRVFVQENPREVEITTKFSSEPLVSNPRNHCVPIIEILTVPDAEDIFLLVMPLLRAFNSPRFNTLGEVIECFGQIFEGLQFMHQNHVAHRDCMDLNIMMDPAGLFPDLFHPQNPRYTRDFKSKPKHYSRTFKPTKYYLIDFGLSRSYDPADGPPRDYPILGGDKTVPEFKGQDRAYNPFPTDIYYIGNMIRECFLQVCARGAREALMQVSHGVEFLAPLVNDMVQDDPTKRPTIDEVVSRFEELRKLLTSWQLRSRLVPLSETGFQRFTRSSAHLVRTAGYCLMRRSALPTP
ncbi:uncharacterized protein PHACADRAFT_96349 [Phanerochaete carnosa HHB-10118-sp]|uniref:Protein kinase domain-containing protein n=1 Tax=Phanerochaete carnosa (strain HHB-10118-sp) TaxID=650164 RepID=K5UXC4_PHACS|nr:uncharacterized protein PHACADRAFT_96349 [Phanerochaete carnosa HHB-10118-sp]EKM54751.1 hypothetical protein PHACADRAFT_96349 [Phanerochaete carnosa HHB-10118-sp]